MAHDDAQHLIDEANAWMENTTLRNASEVQLGTILERWEIRAGRTLSILEGECLFELQHFMELILNGVLTVIGRKPDFNGDLFQYILARRGSAQDVFDDVTSGS